MLPGESALLLGGVLAGTGHISLPLVVVVAIVAAIGGDSVGYEIGRHGGGAIKSSRAGRFVGEQRWARAEAFTCKHGNWAVLVGRWVGLMRALVPSWQHLQGVLGNITYVLGPVTVTGVLVSSPRSGMRRSYARSAAGTVAGSSPRPR
ncbi:DedA family protein [Actinoplanes sp. NPDC051513]|uniref:DedA family protein n=1 Tax=Actinoplanes sp. NPDC051513 TaxID=3363908 RepID=UPI0037A6272A